MSICIAVHGGAGPARPGEDGEGVQQGCLLAARAGHRVLAQGGSALDAVEEAVCSLEDDPRFNAGRGACLNLDGEVELDAGVMDGHSLKAGAVALLREVKNPVRLARAVMEQTPHVFLAGAGAERLAWKLGLSRVGNGDLVTPAALQRWKEAVAAGGGPKVTSGGTVGAIACDAQGHLAAATSTGGTLLKLPGRIGDSPIPGAGVYAEDGAGAASATGHGELILRAGLCRAAVALLARGEGVMEAARAAVAALAPRGGGAGLILVDREGRVGWAFDTERMARAAIDTLGEESLGFLA